MRTDVRDSSRCDAIREHRFEKIVVQRGLLSVECSSGVHLHKVLMWQLISTALAHDSSLTHEFITRCMCHIETLGSHQLRRGDKCSSVMLCVCVCVCNAGKVHCNNQHGVTLYNLQDCWTQNRSRPPLRPLPNEKSIRFDDRDMCSERWRRRWKRAQSAAAAVGARAGQLAEGNYLNVRCGSLGGNYSFD